MRKCCGGGRGALLLLNKFVPSRSKLRELAERVQEARRKRETYLEDVKRIADHPVSVSEMLATTSLSEQVQLQNLCQKQAEKVLVVYHTELMQEAAVGA